MTEPDNLVCETMFRYRNPGGIPAAIKKRLAVALRLALILQRI